MNARKLISLIVTLVSLGSFGCAGEAVVGTWESDGAGSARNRMDVADDMTGEATIYFYYDDDLYSADFDVDATEHDGGYDFELTCRGDCNELDFTMECDLRGDDDELRCSGNGLWEDYELEWEKMRD